MTIKPLDKTINWKRSDFPDDFSFGTATSSYQIEGHSFGGAGSTHWDSFSATPGNVIRQENGAIACDHYHRYEEDLDLVSAAGFDAYRFSASWARVLPDGVGTVNQAGLDYYDRLVDAICERNLKPFLTLYHWELPSALADRGGWCNADIAHWFADYSDILLNRIGDRLHSTSPINEPWCVTWLSHYLGGHAPGIKDLRAASRSMHHVLLAQAKALDVIRHHNAGQTGVVFNYEYAQPVDDSRAALEATAFYDAIYNRWFLEATCQGTYPNAALRYLEPHLPKGWEEDLKTIAQPLDWLGVNYYTRTIVGPAHHQTLPAVKGHSGDLAKTSMGWEIYPKGISEFIQRVYETSGKKTPIYITENGLSSNDKIENGSVDDHLRIQFINDHFCEVKQAIENGVPVKGFFIWSLLDNYEWAAGYDKRFGLVHVDFETLKRTPKASWHAIKQALNNS